MLTYYVYKLHFTTPVHIGPDDGQNTLHSSAVTIHSDTLFAALCVEASRSGNSTAVMSLIEDAQNDQVIFSDLFPFRGEKLFLPKPIISEVQVKIDQDLENRKDYKKLHYLPIDMWKNYVQFGKGQSEFDLDICKEMIKDITFSDRRQRVAVTGQEDPEPYFIQAIDFNDNCGLYCVIGFGEETLRKKYEELLIGLGWSGIGGKRSSGWGKFEIVSSNNLDVYAPDLKQMICKETAERWVTINTSLPIETEMHTVENGRYLLCRRGGFVDHAPYKKKSIYAFGPGSCFLTQYRGEIFNVAPAGRRAAYRLLKPLFLGVNL